jgi:ferredoxin
MKGRIVVTMGDEQMAHVVAEPCLDCKHRDCVTVCPVDCFYEGDRMLYIHPDVCIDCTSCVAVCPVHAIYHEDHLPTALRPYRDLNATLARQCDVAAEPATASRVYT